MPSSSLTRPRSAAVLLSITAFSVSAIVVGPTAASAAPTWCLPTGVLDISDIPSSIDPNICALTGRFLGSGAMQVEVPPPGSGNGAFGTAAADGLVSSLVVHVQPDGTILVNPQTSNAALYPVVDADLYVAPVGGSDDNANGADLDLPDASLTEATVSGAPSKCSDATRAYNTGYPRWVAAPTWYSNASGKPGSYSTATFATATRAAQINLTRGDNSCGFVADPKTYANNGGATTTALQISSTSTTNTCGTQDTRSVVGWGALAGGYIGWTCMRWDASYRMIAGDIRIANNTTWSVGSLTGCVNKWDYESLVTHEFGHFFGLQHVAEATHGNLVMSPNINGKCQANERNLGKGDLLGMLALYGKS